MGEISEVHAVLILGLLLICAAVLLFLIFLKGNEFRANSNWQLTSYVTPIRMPRLVPIDSDQPIQNNNGHHVPFSGDRASSAQTVNTSSSVLPRNPAIARVQEPPPRYDTVYWPLREMPALIPIGELLAHQNSGNGTPIRISPNQAPIPTLARPHNGASLPRARGPPPTYDEAIGEAVARGSDGTAR